MSIVVAVQKDRKLAMAADSLQCYGSMGIPAGNSLDVKIRKIGSAWLGATGWSLYENILDDFVKRQKNLSLTNRQNIFAFFMKLWKDLHKSYSFVNDQCDDTNSPFGDLDSSFLIMNSGGIFHVAGDMGISKFEKYHAVGSGHVFAMGALYALYDSDLDAEGLARKGVEAACAFDVNCGGEIQVVTMNLRKNA